ncbi:hypothetical protein OF83DRAFT_1057967 [Amylostereum chailletii]|nr:hypothetical protein OF83DRAFT_1057967 [Amylostereum chailletii]
MSRLRQPSSSLSLSQSQSPLQRHLRIFASGTVFLTHSLSLPHHPAPSSNVRAHAYVRTRNGSACTVLSILAQLRTVGVEGCWLVASLGGNDEGRDIIRELETAGVNTRYCKVWEGHGVPGAWVLQAGDTDTQSVINHNPLPDITHEEFISILGPLLAPENYPPPTSPTVSDPSTPSSPDYSQYAPPRPSPAHPNAAPFEWLHFEGRSVKTTLNNLVGLDGLARERKWRSQCVFSVDVGRRARQGVEALIPHADVLFLNKHYAEAHSPAYASTPRAFLLSLTHLAPPHALLVAYWGSHGAAVLSVPTREYFQSSGWVDDTPAAVPPSPTSVRSGDTGHSLRKEEAVSVRSGSDFWAGGRESSMSTSMFSAALLTTASSPSPGPGTSHHDRDAERSWKRHNGKGKGKERRHADDDSDSDADSQGTEIAASSNGNSQGQRGGAARRKKREETTDEVGAQDAFVAGMIYALSRKILPGPPYAPGLANHTPSTGTDSGRWRLDECLRFATELAGRKARKQGLGDLGLEMARAGWFE